MNKTQPVLPPHYSQVATEISNLNQAIKHDLSHQPRPDGLPWEVPGQISPLLEEMLDLIDALGQGLNTFSESVLSADTPLTDAEVRQAFQPVASPVKKLLEIHQTLWQRHFPADLEPGQALLSEIMQRPLRDLLAMFERMLVVIADPASAVDSEGNLTIPFHLYLEVDREVRTFTRWCRNVTESETRRRREKRASSPPAKNPQDKSFGQAIAAFILGWWWGSR